MCKQKKKKKEYLMKGWASKKLAWRLVWLGKGKGNAIDTCWAWVGGTRATCKLTFPSRHACHWHWSCLPVFLKETCPLLHNATCYKHNYCTNSILHVISVSLINVLIVFVNKKIILYNKIVFFLRFLLRNIFKVISNQLLI